jgi:hypothetical protein
MISKDNKVEHKNTEKKRNKKSHQHKDEEISIENTKHGLWSSLGKKTRVDMSVKYHSSL